jgi:DNA-directed RNA polymerase specialized sigma24 family protein
VKAFSGTDTSQIARVLGCGESTVRNHLFNARRILRRELERIHPGFRRPRS